MAQAENIEVLFKSSQSNERKVANKMKNDCREKSKISSALYSLYESESDVFYVGFEIIDMAFPYFILAIMVQRVYLHCV